MPTLAIVTVSWNVRDLLRHCLQAVEASLAGSGIATTIIVADNQSADGTPAMLRSAFPHVRLIETGANLGFAGGNNAALRVLPEGTDYVLLLNPDTEPLGDAIPQLVRHLEAHPELVAVGPQLRYGDGSLQSSRRRFPTRLMFFWESTPLERLWPGNPWARRYHCAERPADVVQTCDWLVGAALLVRTAAIQHAGLLDEGFFMYSEELEWQMRLQRSSTGPGPPAGETRIGYLPEAVIMHYEGRSSEQAIAHRHLNFQRSKLRLARLLYGSGFAFTLRLFLVGCYLWETAIESAKLMLGHRPELRRRRLGVYAEVVRRLVWNA